MTVPRDHDLESGHLRLQIQLRQIMEDVDGDAIQLNNLGLRQLAGPPTVINVSANRSEWCNCGQFFENFGIANIPGVNDVVRAAQYRDRFWPKQSMSVGDDADQDGCPQLSRFLPIRWFSSAWDGPPPRLEYVPPSLTS